ncbi:MAG: tetracycline regulation of excision, RteC, partial [Flavobacteriaceae bacterium CG17_big_fil_post_rev_8_21_14_2_50_33_15]
MEYQELIAEFETKLEALESCNDDVLYVAESGITHTERCIKNLRKEVVEKGFDSTQE